MRQGETVITYRTITLAPETEFAIVARADTAPTGFPGDFVETRLGPEGVYLNDHVTVDCRHEGKRLVAEDHRDRAGGRRDRRRGTPMISPVKRALVGRARRAGS